MKGVALVTTLAVLLASSWADKHEREPPGEGYEFVTCGSTIKLSHEPSKYRLHSHEVQYGTGSQQQSVTMVKALDDPNSLWTVAGDLDKGCVRGSKIEAGKVIRLQHVSTKRWLHSHKGFASPLSNNQEVSAFGGKEDSNTADHWKVEPENNGKFWEREKGVRLKHVDTNMYLHATGTHQYSRPIDGQREVCATGKASNMNKWVATEGFYLKTSKKGAADA